MKIEYFSDKSCWLAVTMSHLPVLYENWSLMQTFLHIIIVNNRFSYHNDVLTGR